MTRRHEAPPRIATSIVRRLLADELREAWLGDLHERFARRARQRGLRHARSWYWRQALAFCLRIPLAHMSDNIRGHATAGAELSSADGPPPGHGKRGSLVSDLLTDWRYTLRYLRTNPGFATIVVATLAIGIGANSAIFSVVDAVLLRPLPYARPDRIVQVWGSQLEIGVQRWGASLHDFEDWRKSSDTLEEIGAYNVRAANLSYGEVPERVGYALVSPSVFDVLGVPPALGRTFTEDENRPGNDSVVVLGHDFWVGALGAKPEVVGDVIVLDGAPMTVVGVMPEGFYFPATTTQLWKPFGMRPDDAGDRDGRWVSCIGRLAPGASLDEARSEMAATAAALETQYPETNRGIGVFLERRYDFVVLSSRPMLLTTWAIVGLVLFIACANVANLVLARSTARAREMALRASLGAGRGRLVRQLLSESLVFGLAGGGAGVLLAAWITSLLRGMTATGIPRLAQVDISGSVVVYTLALSVLTAGLFGIAPALRTTSFDLSAQLKDGPGRSGGHRRHRGREILVAVELAVSVVVLIAAALLLRTFWSLQRVDLGFEIDGRLEARLAPSWREYPEREQAQALYARVIEHLGSVPGVESVGLINSIPLVGANMWGTRLLGDGIEADTPDQAVRVQFRTVAGEYFQTMGIELLAGRYFDGRDLAASTPAVVLSRRAAREAWPDTPTGRTGSVPTSAVGKQVWFAPPDHPAHMRYTVVGVVDDVIDNNLQRGPNPLVYTSFMQPGWGHFQDWGMSIIARASADPVAVMQPVRAALLEVAPGLPLFDVQTLEDRLSTALGPSRFNLTTIGAFGTVALLLAVGGVYGVMACTVGQRTHEIGVRVALGAGLRQVASAIVVKGMALAAIGVGSGLLTALGMSTTIETMLFGVDSTDPISYASIAALLLAVAFVASFVPALRAARIDPLVCLRQD